MKKTYRVLVSTVADVADNKPAKVVWTGTDTQAAHDRRIAEEQASEKVVAWVE